MRIPALLGTAALLIAAPAMAGDDYKMTKTTMTTASADFASYDSNRDGRVDFNEYYKMAKKDGVSSTLAAQRFNKMTSGSYMLDEGSFMTAMSSDATYYDTVPFQSNTTVISNTAVLSDTTMSPADPLNPANPVDVYDDFEQTGKYMDDQGPIMESDTFTYDSGMSGATSMEGSLPRATVDPGYRPSDKVGGDLTQTDNPMMDVRPATIGTEIDTDVDIDIDESIDGDAGIGATYSDFRDYEVGDGEVGTDEDF